MMGWPGFATVAGFAVMVAVIQSLPYAWILVVGIILCVIALAVMLRTAVKR